MRRFIPLFLAVGCVAILSLVARQSQAEAGKTYVIEQCRKALGEPMDSNGPLFEIGPRHVLELVFEGDTLTVLEVVPKNRFEYLERHPDWESDQPSFLSPAEYTSVLQKITLIAAPGDFIERTTDPIVTNMRYVQVDRHTKAFIVRNIEAPWSYSGSSEEERVRSFSVVYLRQVTGTVSNLRSASPAFGKQNGPPLHQVLLNDKVFYVTADQMQHLKVGEISTFEGAGPINEFAPLFVWKRD